MSYTSRVSEFLVCHAKHQSWADTAHDMKLGVEQVRRLARIAGVDNADYGKDMLATRNADWHEHGKPKPKRPVARTKHYDSEVTFKGGREIPKVTLDTLPSLLLPMPVLRDD